MLKRPVQVAVISDVHLGTYGCRASELLNYLRSIQPSLLVLNGDIIDGWQFSKRYFPTAHMQVIKEIFHLLSKGTRVVYITGNHDEMLRRYSDISIGQFTLTDKMVIELNGKMTWIFHGDVFDRTTKGSAKAIAKLGGWGYDFLILINSAVNKLLVQLGREKLSFSKTVKNSVKKAVKWISNFEETAAELAIEKNYDTVICGHIHQPQKKIIETKDGKVEYLNSGDWIENLTALEYDNNQWNIYYYDPSKFNSITKHIDTKLPELNVLTDEVSMIIAAMSMPI